ncbi:MAG TPA: type II toxin-antitoxin system Phd/YefM family antitoxin [Leucothrix mucor]|nr:type II toxin-antitoxin system Phd/YefM family antitoxin [Leucothrix mucor]
MKITNISEAKANLSYLINIIQETGESIIIGKAGKPVALLSAIKRNTLPRTLGAGSWVGKVTISDDFDDTHVDDFYESVIFPE